MMTQLGKESWLKDMPKWKQQKLYDYWDFTSMSTLKKECILSSEITKFDDELMPKIFAADNLDVFINSIIPTPDTGQDSLINSNNNSGGDIQVVTEQSPTLMKQWATFLHSKLRSPKPKQDLRVYTGTETNETNESNISNISMASNISSPPLLVE